MAPRARGRGRSLTPRARSPRVVRSVVRKFGRSTSGEEWNTASQVDPRYAWEQPQTWQGVLDASQQLLAIETPARPEGLA